MALGTMELVLLVKVLDIKKSDEVQLQVLEEALPLSINLSSAGNCNFVSIFTNPKSFGGLNPSCNPGG